MSIYLKEGVHALQRCVWVSPWPPIPGLTAALQAQFGCPLQHVTLLGRSPLVCLGVCLCVPFVSATNPRKPLNSRFPWRFIPASTASCSSVHRGLRRWRSRKQGLPHPRVAEPRSSSVLVALVS